MIKRVIPILLVSLLAACGDSKVSPLPSEQTGRSSASSVEQKALREFRSERVEKIVIAIASMSDDKFQALTKKEKFDLVSRIFSSFENMELADYYRHSPDQDVIGLARSYTKEQATSYIKRSKSLLDDIQGSMTPDENAILTEKLAKIPYIADLEKQKIVAKVFDDLKPVILEVGAITTDSGKFPTSKDEIKSSASFSNESVSSFNLLENGVLEITFKESVNSSKLTMIPYRVKKMNNETGDVSTSIDWKCMMTPPTAMKFKPEGCKE